MMGRRRRRASSSCDVCFRAEWQLKQRLREGVERGVGRGGLAGPSVAHGGERR